MFQAGLPHFAVGPVVKGFGRGSKELRIPTANYPDEVVQNLPLEIGPGVYCGWASINKGEVYKMVMSIGWNPYYENTHKTMETHIMHNFQEEFYGSELRVVLLGFLRPEIKFTSLDDLIVGIRADITTADKLLDEPLFAAYRSNNFFTGDNQEEIKIEENNHKKSRWGFCLDIDFCIAF